jgi:pimeloyl-ACP methyl ester carboxylesterase/ADP-ribose pyrophosphatase YjhB (NUDIX family)
MRFLTGMLRFAALAAFALTTRAALAQGAPPRTWPELKEAVQQRADRNAYPMTGMKPADVREILAGIDSLDRDQWAASWSKMGARYAAQGDELAGRDPTAAREAYLMAFRYGAFGAWPTPNSPGKRKALAAGIADFHKYAALSDPAIEVVQFPYDDKTVNAYLVLPKGPRPAPVVLAIGGLDSYKEYWCERAAAFLKAGIGVLCLDMPGTGESPVKVDVGAEKMYSAAIDYMLTRKDVDGKRLAAVGVSWGGYWSAILGFTEKARLRGTVVQGGPVHNYFQQEWQAKALGTREYLFDLFPARASVYGVSTLDEFFAYGPRMSLEARGFVGQPSAPMLLINGVKDTQVPIEDLFLLQRTGTPKEAWVNPQGGHVGRGPGWPDEKILTDVAVPWLARLLNAQGE